MTAQDLKNSILQLAMQGKLVPQNPNDEPASEILKRIKEEKARLIKEGRIKRVKPLTPIFEEEKPFDIPEGWQWVRLHQIGEIIGGGTPKTNDQKCWMNGDIPWITPADMREKVEGKYISRGSRDITIYGLQKSSAQLLPENSLVFSSRAPIGYIAIAKNSLSTNQGFKSIVPYDFDIIEYLYYCIQARTKDIEQRASGTTFKEISGTNFGLTIVPLPPLLEQKRIVAKIEELLLFVEKYDESEKRLLELNKKFPDKLRKSILQQAVQGKLTEQDPYDEPASELLKRIKAEKARLIKEGRIKKEKPLPPISEEIPFDIPESWEWVRFNEIVSFENGDRSNKYPKDSDLVVSGIPFWGAADMINGELKYSGDLRYISTEKYEELRSGKLVDGDYVCLLRGAVGKWAKFTANETYSTGFINAQMIIMRLIDLQLSPYFRVFLQSTSFELQKKQNVTGSAIAQMSAANLHRFLIPIPPLVEQKRIVARVEELLPLCYRLE